MRLSCVQVAKVNHTLNAAQRCKSLNAFFFTLLHHSEKILTLYKCMYVFTTTI